MGSPITLSGFNKIDFSMILNSIMAQEQQPLNNLSTKKSTLESQNTLFSTLATKLGSLEGALEALRKTDSLASISATSSDTGVGISTGTGTVEGTYAVVVSELAKSQVLTSSSSYAALTDVVADSGTLTLTPATGTATTITLTGPTTVQGMADLINAKSDSPVAASVVQTAPGSYKLMLTGKSTGTTNAFTVTKTLTGGSGLTFTDTDADGTYGDSAADNTQNALNASFTVNGLAVQSASNTVTDVVPGVTLSLKKKDPASTVTIEVKKDLDDAKTLVNKFISTYNDVITFTRDQNTAAIAGKASIGRDPVLRQFKDSAGAALRDQYALGGTFTRLAEVGVGFDINGKLTLDGDIFEKAMETSSIDVQKLFSGTDGTGGVFGSLHALVDQFTQTGGFVSDAKQRLTDQVSSLSRRIDAMADQLAIRKTALQQQFTAADLEMTRLNAQSSSMSSIGGQYRLF